MWSLMGFFGLLPFLLELAVLYLAHTRFHVIDQVEQIQRTLEQDSRASYQKRLEAENNKFKPISSLPNAKKLDNPKKPEVPPAAPAKKPENVAKKPEPEPALPAKKPEPPKEDAPKQAEEGKKEGTASKLANFFRRSKQ